MTNREWLNTLSYKELAGFLTNGLFVTSIKHNGYYTISAKEMTEDYYGSEIASMACWLSDEQEYEVAHKNQNWVITENGCVITCPKCGHRLELCYPDGTEVRYLPHCPWCGKKLEK